MHIGLMQQSAANASTAYDGDTKCCTLLQHQMSRELVVTQL
jgi:hypothetical protein